jgi:hypothetical protein
LDTPLKGSSSQTPHQGKALGPEEHYYNKLVAGWTPPEAFKALQDTDSHVYQINVTDTGEFEVRQKQGTIEASIFHVQSTP